MCVCARVCVRACALCVKEQTNRQTETEREKQRQRSRERGILFVQLIGLCVWEIRLMPFNQRGQGRRHPAY